MNLAIGLGLDRIRTRAWFVPLAIITSLLYTLGLLELYPIMAVRARMLSLPFVWFWAWRSGALSGIAATLIVDNIIQDAVYSMAWIPDTDSSFTITSAFQVLNVTSSVVLGRTAMLGRRLRLELERRTRAEALLRESEACYRVLFDANPVPIWVADCESKRFLAYNIATLKHYGYSADELNQMGLSSFLPPGEVDHPDLPAARRHRKKDGTLIDVEVIIHPIHFRGREARLVLATDVTDRKQAQERLEYQAHHDALTGLPNRVAFRSGLERAIRRAQDLSSPLAIFLFDLDRFKDINDSMGHAYGDQALQQIGPRLQGFLREGDLLARLGGDEFGIFLPGVGEQDALRIATRLLEAFHEPFVFDGRLFDVGLSIGIALYPDHGSDIESLTHRADLAMYDSKRSRGGAVLYGHDLEPDELLSLAAPITVESPRSSGPDFDP